MGTKTVMYSINTQRSLPEVKQALIRALMPLGGVVTDMGEYVQIKEGKNNVNFGFTANFDAMVNIRQSAPDRYDFFGTINWNPSTIFWVCLVLGFILFGIAWIVNLLYFFIDPTAVYQQALYQTQSFLQ